MGKFAAFQMLLARTSWRNDERYLAANLHVQNRPLGVHIQHSNARRQSGFKPFEATL
jgi:hypothetical protein